MRLGGLILAGGRSRRMGRPKEALPLGDTTLLGWQCRTLLACTDDVVVVGRDPHQALPPVPAGVRIAFDAVPDQGPLAAIRAGLAFFRDHLGYGRDDAAMATGCDQPFLTPAIVRWLVDRLARHDLVMPRANGKLQPLTAVYSLRVLAAAERLLDQQRRRPRELADAVPSPAIVEEPALRTVDPALDFLDNLNHTADYERARRVLESRGPAPGQP